MIDSVWRLLANDPQAAGRTPGGGERNPQNRPTKYCAGSRTDAESPIPVAR